MEAVASTTRVLMEAIAAVKVLPALAFSAGFFFLLRAAAVESNGKQILVCPPTLLMVQSYGRRTNDRCVLFDIHV